MIKTRRKVTSSMFCQPAQLIKDSVWMNKKGLYTKGFWNQDSVKI